MKKLKKTHIVLIATSLLILACCVGLTLWLLFSNYQNVRLFKQAQSNYLRGDKASLDAAEAQLLQLIRNDADNEEAYIMLGSIAGKRKIYPEQMYYCYTAHRLNPLRAENKEHYIKSLLFAREFERLENFLSHDSSLNERHQQYLLYAAARNGSFNKYRNISDKHKGAYDIAGLALLLVDKTTPGQKLAVLKKIKTEDAFFQQEIYAAQAEFSLESADITGTEKALLKAYALNPFAFAPALGRFYANFRSFGKALQIFEEYLKTYHDVAIALQTAEIYCLLRQTEKIVELRTHYQSDSGNTAMLSCYYLDALTALAKNDGKALKEFTVPLRKNINTPLAAFMYLCVDLADQDMTGIQNSYKALLEHRTYLDLQDRADRMVAAYLRRIVAGQKGTESQLYPLAELLYQRKPDAFTAKILLLSQRKQSVFDSVLLRDALKRFGKDPGILKIAIEYYMEQDLQMVETLIATYKKQFPGKVKEMLRYEIIASVRQKKYDAVSALFRKNFEQDLRREYWAFASSTMRADDLRFLSKDKLYAPYCQALLFLSEGKKDAACALLEKADAKGNLALLFFAARILGENGKNQAALKQYAMFPPESPYKLAVLLNTSELYAENGNLEKSLTLASQAYALAPDRTEPQLCYADKLDKAGKHIAIPDVIKLDLNRSSNPYRTKLKRLWVKGMEERIRRCDPGKQKEKLRVLCKRLLSIVPDNDIALKYLKLLEMKR